MHKPLIPMPNLDDRTYADLVEEALALIPGSSPDWTDNNPADPGITLIELLAWLTEMVLYRVNQIPARNYETFLKLVGGSEKIPDREDDRDPNEKIRETILSLNERSRAVSCEDYEYLALHKWPESGPGKNEDRIRRAKCIPNCNLAKPCASSPLRADGHVSLVIVPDLTDQDLEMGIGPDDDLCRRLLDWLHDWKLITTRLHVVGPEFIEVEIQADLKVKSDTIDKEAFKITDIEDVLDDTVSALKKFFHPFYGGPDNTGWPFGRNVYVSEIYKILSAVPGIDYGENVRLTALNANRLMKADGRQNDGTAYIWLRDHELVNLKVSRNKFRIR